MASPLARKSISIIRDLMENPPTKRNPDGGGIDFAIYNLRRRAGQIVGDSKLLADVLALGEEITRFRGKGCQIGAENMSQLFGTLVRKIAEKLPECDSPFISFSDAREAHPSLATSWDALANLYLRARACVEGPPSRSRHVATLRAEAHYQLGQIAHFVHDCNILGPAFEGPE